MADENKQYVCGFLFFDKVIDKRPGEDFAFAAGTVFNFENVLLILKDRPVWQAGNFNGIGGKVEAGELPIDAMVRETFEETDLEIPAERWEHYCTMKGPDFEVQFYKAFLPWIRPWIQKTSEGLVSFPVNKLPANLVNSNRYLIPMAREKDMKKAIIKTV